jgi:hypothetical protein
LTRCCSPSTSTSAITLCRWLGCLTVDNRSQARGEPMKRAGRPLVALADLVVGGEEERLRGRRRFGCADRLREVAADERVCVALVWLQAGERPVGVDAGEAELRRDEIGVGRRDDELAGAADLGLQLERGQDLRPAIRQIGSR